MPRHAQMWLDVLLEACIAYLALEIHAIVLAGKTEHHDNGTIPGAFDKLFCEWIATPITRGC